LVLWNKLKTSPTYEYLGDVDIALQTFYVEAIGKATRQAGVSEYKIRDWCETKLITASGTRSIINREFETTGGIPNRVVDILENMDLIRGEYRSGTKWYKLTYDRYIIPIINSNKTFRGTK